MSGFITRELANHNLLSKSFVQKEIIFLPAEDLIILVTFLSYQSNIFYYQSLRFLSQMMLFNLTNEVVYLHPMSFDPVRIVMCSLFCSHESFYQDLFSSTHVKTFQRQGTPDSLNFLCYSESFMEGGLILWSISEELIYYNKLS